MSIGIDLLLVSLGLLSCQPYGSSVCWVKDLGSNAASVTTTCAAKPIVPMELESEDRLGPVAEIVQGLQQRARGCTPSMCGSARLTVVGDGFPTAWVERQDRALRFFVSIGMIHLVEKTAAATLAELEATSLLTPPAGGLGAWFEDMNARGGQACVGVSGASAPAASTKAPSLEERALSSSIYAFIFSHELAHIIRGQDCGSRSVDPFEIEHACDLAAYEELKARGLSPVLVVLWLTVMHHHEQALSVDVMNRSEVSGRSYVSIFPARDWTRRARELFESWRSECDVEKTLPTCREIWKGDARTAEMVLEIPRPTPCLNVKPAKSEIVDSAAANACLHRERDGDRPAVDYNQNGRPNLVSLSVRYRNSCNRALRCRATLASGTVPRDSPQGAWLPYTSTQREVSLKPGEVKNVSALLRWNATRDRMPSVRFPGGAHDLPGFLQCEFSEAEQERMQIAKECEPLHRYLRSATNEFRDLLPAQGSELYQDVTALEGTRTCFVTPADWVSAAMLHCEIIESKNDELLDVAYTKWADLVQRCLASPLWRSDEDQGSSSSRVYRTITFARSETEEQVKVIKRISTVDEQSSVSVYISSPKREESAQPPSPAWSRLPTETVADLDSALDRMLLMIDGKSNEKRSVLLQINPPVA